MRFLTDIVCEEVEKGCIARRGCLPQEDEEGWEPDALLLDGRPQRGCLLRHNLLWAKTRQKNGTNKTTNDSRLNVVVIGFKKIRRPFGKPFGSNFLLSYREHNNIMVK